MVQGKEHSIFIVDDEPSNFDIMEPVLEAEGYFLAYAPNAERALLRLDAVNPNLILLDVMMPGIDGVELCKTIKAMPQWQYTPIIMVTALTAKEDLARCLDAGADDFISKPINFQELKARVRSMLRIREQFEQIQELMTARDAMFNMIVHDLRNPLTSISMTAEIIGRYYHDHVDEKYTERLTRSADKMSRLVNDILLIGKLQTTLPQADKQAIDVNQLAEGVLGDAEVFASQMQVQLQNYVPLSPAIAHLDIYLVRRALDNLLTNAIKFSPVGTSIELRISRPDADQIQFDVIDEGTGVLDEKKAAIFDPYHSNDRTENIATIGLGLTFCKTVAEIHGGRISVSDNQPQGSIFTLLLPNH
ncbi:MAG: hybrid sensor histidine kinase/response regulator [Synechocystis sp.]